MGCELGGEAADAEGQRRGPAQPRAVADHDLDAPAADVDAERRRGLEHEAGPHRGEDEPGLLEPADDLDLDSGLGLDPVDELAAVGGGADRARCLRDHLVRAQRVGELAEASNARDGPLRRGRRDPAFARHLVAEPEHLLLARDGLERAVGVHVGDEQVEGVGAEVERCDAHVASSVTSAGARA